MSDEGEDYARDPLDDEFDSAMNAATELAVHVERIGMQELELPVPEDGNVWVVNIRKLGIKASEEDAESEPPAEHDGTLT
jgi:hypothetical protein